MRSLVLVFVSIWMALIEPVQSMDKFKTAWGSMKEKVRQKAREAHLPSKSIIPSTFFIQNRFFLSILL